MPADPPVPEMDHAALMNAAPTPMFAFDARGRCTWVNAAAEGLCGRNFADLRGHVYAELVAPIDWARLARQVLRQRRRHTATS